MKRSLMSFLLAAALMLFPGMSYAAGWHGGGHGSSHAWHGSYHAGYHGNYHGGGYHGGWHGGYHGGWYGGYHGGWRGSVIIGGPWWWGAPWPYPYYTYPYGYYAPPYSVYPPAVISGPQVYIQRDSPAAAAQGYWYYCQSAKGYYPSVQTCPEGWIKIPPTPH